MPPEAGTHTPVIAGLCMAGTALLVSAPVGYLLPHVGRVKLLLPVSTLMTSLLLALLILDETRSRAAAAYFVIGCVWSVCDCCAQLCLAGEVKYFTFLYQEKFGYIAVRRYGYIGSHSVTCHPAEMTFPHLLQPVKAGTRFSDPGGMQG